MLLWRQSNRLVAGEKLWEAGRARDPEFTCAKMFWWYNMYSSADWSATPRPMYPADGRKIPDHYTRPVELRDELDARLGQFPLFKFWGPLADITSSAWIARATLHVIETRRPTLTLTSLPHLDYNLQRLGPDTENPTQRRTWRRSMGWSASLSSMPNGPGSGSWLSVNTGSRGRRGAGGGRRGDLLAGRQPLVVHRRVVAGSCGRGSARGMGMMILELSVILSAVVGLRRA